MNHESPQFDELRRLAQWKRELGEDIFMSTFFLNYFGTLIKFGVNKI